MAGVVLGSMTGARDFRLVSRTAKRASHHGDRHVSHGPNSFEGDYLGVIQGFCRVPVNGLLFLTMAHIRKLDNLAFDSGVCRR